jgi:hypothetical protein
MTTATKERITVYLPPQLKQELARAAEEAGQTKSLSEAPPTTARLGGRALRFQCGQRERSSAIGWLGGALIMAARAAT